MNLLYKTIKCFLKCFLIDGNFPNALRACGYSGPSEDSHSRRVRTRLVIDGLGLPLDPVQGCGVESARMTSASMTAWISTR